MKAGKPGARLVRYEWSEEPRNPGALRGKIGIAADFDELPDDIARAREEKLKLVTRSDRLGEYGIPINRV